MAVDATTRAALVEHARLSIKRGSQSFSAASQLFDNATRERAWLLYAWCRRADDIADAQELGGALGDRSEQELAPFAQQVQAAVTSAHESLARLH